MAETIVPFFGKLKAYFPYKRKYVDAAFHTLQSIRIKTLWRIRDFSREVIFVGIHVRRTDYSRHLRNIFYTEQAADIGYYHRAITWMRTTLFKTTGTPVTIACVVSSDDPDWCQQELIPQLQNSENHSNAEGVFQVFYGGKGRINTPEHDLVLLSYCNHSIFAYGTFGLWSALMAGGRTAVYNISDIVPYKTAQTTSMEFASYLNGWVVL